MMVGRSKRLSVEHIEETIPLENGSTLIGGTFDVAIEFYGDVLGYNSDDLGVKGLFGMVGCTQPDCSMSESNKG